MDKTAVADQPEDNGDPRPVVASYLVRIVQRARADERRPLTNVRLEEVVKGALEDELGAYGAFTVSSERVDR